MATRNLKAIRRARDREPQLVEGPKQLLVLKGPNSSAILNEVLTDLTMMKKPDSKSLTRKNDIRPFEDASSLEFLCDKNSCSSFLYASHNKKRPNNLVLGRMFDRHLLDMMELGVVGYEPISEVEGPKKMVGSSPLMVFAGDEWERTPELEKLRSLLLDVFAARDVTGVALAGIDHVICVTAVDKTVYWRPYFVHMKKSTTKIPRVELTLMGPSLDFVVRRTHFASSDLEKAALKQPKALEPKKAKNTTTNMFGETLGRLHMERQDFSKLTMRKGKAARADRKRKASDMEEGGDGEEEQAGGNDVAMDGPSGGSEAPSSSAAYDEEDEFASSRRKKVAKKQKVAVARGASSEFDA